MRRRASWAIAVVLLIAPVGGGQAPEPPEKIPAPLRTPLPLDPAPIVSDPPLFVPQPRVPAGYVEGDALLWWATHGPAPILLTTAPNNGLNANGLTGGTLGQPGTTILFDGNNLAYSTFIGARITAGVNLGADGFWSLEASGLYLPHRSIDYTSVGKNDGTPLLTIPFLDAATGQQASLDINSQDAAFNPFLIGSIAIHSDLQVWGAEVNAIAHSVRTAERSIDVFAGLRMLNLEESLAINQAIVPTQDGNITLQYPTAGLGAANYFPVVAGALVQVTDSFVTHNQFYGGQLGGRFRWDYGAVSLGLTGKIAVGITHQQVAITGSSSASAAINPNTGAVVTNLTTPGGAFALQNNIGTYAQNPFTVVPELGLQLTWSPASWLRLHLGYSILYWSNVARPGAQIDSVLNSKLVPTGALLPTNTVPVGAFVPGAEQGRPYFTFNDSAFWAQGIQLGIEIRY
jgi:hypothetical protein